MTTVHVAAVDLGASSGRVVLGEVGRSTLRIETVARFPNDPVRTPDGLHWNLLGLYAAALRGLAVAARVDGGLASIGVDSWAVDYGLVGDGRLLGTPYHYRDESRCAAGPTRVHAVVTPEELYRRNGLQFLPFNTVYQLAADPWVKHAEQLLLVPDLLSFWLTGEVGTERTNASTSGLLDVHTGDWDRDLIATLGLPPRVFTDLVDPGTRVGTVLPGVGEALAGLPVVAVGSHDTASAVVGVPMESADAAYVSCGTWGLVGLELDKPVVGEASRAANFTNEGGVDDRIRFLTNVMGLWLLSESLRSWGLSGDDLPRLLAAAAEVEDVPLFDVQDDRFLPPGDMPGRIQSWYAERDLAAPSTRPALVRAIVESLAQAFADSVDRAADLAGRTVSVIHVVGGGAQNSLLCQRIADRSGRRVVAGPVEATALGNVLVQARAAGSVTGDLEELRGLISRTHELPVFLPRAGHDRMVP